MKKRIQTAAFIFMICLTTFIVGMEQQDEAALKKIGQLIKKDCGCLVPASYPFSKLVKTFKEEQLDTNDVARQHVIEKMVKQSKKPFPKSHRYFAEELAQHNSEYMPLVTSIDDAFKSEKDITDSWQANVTDFAIFQSYYVPGRIESVLLTPLGFAIRWANYEWCCRLIGSGANVNKNYYDESEREISPLCDVINWKNRKKDQKDVYYRILCLLLEYKADVNIGYMYSSCHHMRPLRFAAGLKDEESAKALLLYGAVLPEGAVLQNERQWLASIEQQGING